MFGFRKPNDSYTSTFVHPSSAQPAAPETAAFCLRVEAKDGHDVRDFRFASPECMEGFIAGIRAAKDMGANLDIGKVDQLHTHSLDVQEGMQHRDPRVA